MAEGWLIDSSDNLIWGFHRDNSAWVRDPKVFIDRGRQMPNGPPLLKERRYLRKDAAEQLWRSLLVQEWKPLKEPAWGASADAFSVRQTVSTNAYQGVLDRFHRMRATNPGDQALLGLFLENAHSTHRSHASLVRVLVAWRRRAQRHF